MTTQTVALRRLFRLVNGGTPSAEPDNWGGDVPWATPVDLAKVDGGAIGPTERTLTAAGLASGSRLVTSGSLIVSTRAPIGYVAETEVPMAFNQGCRGLVPSSEAIDVRFVKYQLIARRPDLQSLGNGSTFQELGSDTLGSFPLVHLPADQQRRIADFLDTETARIDALIAAKHRQSALLQMRFKVEARMATSQGDFVALRRLLSATKTGTTPTDLELDDSDNGVPWYSPSDFGPGLDLRPAVRRLPAASVTTRKVPRFSAGSVLVVGIGATAGLVGHLAQEGTGNQQVTALTPNQHLNDRYLAWWLWGRSDELRELAPYTTLPILNNDYLKAVKINAPGITEQAAVAALLDRRAASISDATSTLNAQIALLRERRQALITAAGLEVHIGMKHRAA